jgi:hypothetical protein
MEGIDPMRIKQGVMLFPILCHLVLLACGVYSFSGSGLPSHIKTVAVPLFGNQTAEYGIKEKLTDEILNSLVEDGKLKVAGRDDADSIINGAVVDYKNVAYTYDKSENVQEYIVRIYVDVSYEDAKERKVIWEQKRMEGWGTYDVQTEPPEDEEMGRERAIAKLAEDIVNQTVAGW